MNASILSSMIYMLIVWFIAPGMVLPGVVICGFLLSIPSLLVLALVRGGKL
jgi:hypothetical protein